MVTEIKTVGELKRLLAGVSDDTLLDFVKPRASTDMNDIRVTAPHVEINKGNPMDKTDIDLVFFMHPDDA